MTPQTGARLLFGSFALTVATIIYHEVHGEHRAPPPVKFIAAGTAYGILGLAAPFISYQVAGMLGAGVLVAMLYRQYGGTLEQRQGE